MASRIGVAHKASTGAIRLPRHAVAQREASIETTRRRTDFKVQLEIDATRHAQKTKVAGERSAERPKQADAATRGCGPRCAVIFKRRGSGGHEPVAVAAHMSSAIVLSTWDHGLAANARALEVLGAGGSALDAAEAGTHLCMWLLCCDLLSGS